MYSTGNGLTRFRAGSNSITTVLAYIYLVLISLAVAAFVSLSVKHVTIEVGNKKMSCYTFAPTVSAVLKEMGARQNFGPERNPSSLEEGEILNYYTLSKDLNQKISDGIQIRITHNRVEKIAETREVSVPVKRQWDIFLDRGKQKIIDPGRKGLIKDTVMVYYRDGKITQRKKVASQVVVKPRPTVIACGSYDIVSRQGPVRSGRAYKFESTAYTYTGYRTATGAKTRRGIVAVDPRVIPLGTRLYVEGYGYAVAADTGGAIKGRIIDVFIESESGARKWGRRSVNVYILNK